MAKRERMSMDERMLIAQLATMMQERGVTAKDVADEGDISERAVTYWLRGERRLPFSGLVAFMRALGMRMEAVER